MKGALWAGLVAAVGISLYVIYKQSQLAPVAAGGQTTPGNAPSNTAGATVTQAHSGQVASTVYYGSQVFGSDGGFDYASLPDSAIASAIDQELNNFFD